MALLLASGCAPRLEREQALGELRELARVHAVFRQPSADLDSPCVDAGAVRGRLITDANLAGQGGVTASLQRASEALLAVCGAAQLLRSPGDETAAVRAARVRWEDQMQRELGEACRALQDAAAGLAASPPDCGASSAPTSSS